MSVWTHTNWSDEMLFVPYHRRNCKCCPNNNANTKSTSLKPIVCLVPKYAGPPAADAKGSSRAPEPASVAQADGDFQFLDEEYIKKHFKLQPRALYLDPTRRPLITFPMTQEETSHFNLARKYKINQQILDGYLDSSEAISAPSVFPYPVTVGAGASGQGAGEEEEEVVYILRLPDLQQHCPVHNITVNTPRFLWHSVKKSSKADQREPKKGAGPMHKPKPWLLSRHTDFDYLSQW